MTVTASSFRTNHREFADYSVYADCDIERWIELAYKFMKEDRWGNVLDYGVELWVAHNLFVANEKITTGDIAGITGIMTSQHVGEVGFTADPKLFFQGLKNIGFYARTSFGIQWWQLAQVIGSGGFQL